MDIIIITIIIISGISNMIADILLYSGKDHKNKNQTKEERVMRTPDKNIIISGILGLISVSFWILPNYYLSKINTSIGFITMTSFGIFIVSLATFHVVCCFIMIFYKWNNDMIERLLKLMNSYRLVCVFYAGIYTLSMIYLSIDEVLKMNIFQYISLPFFSFIIFQLMLGKILKKIPHFSSVAGTLGMIISLIGTISIMTGNNIV
ncbi:hypothetical protein [Senegalia sp. (in: firmicutes)]|uniref:hypothetical protein n=1 Tax=Senegalia sp. (in: firmicutes) TaxID=1924098 RepID=UPI003F9B7308